MLNALHDIIQYGGLIFIKENYSFQLRQFLLLRVWSDSIMYSKDVYIGLYDISTD